MKLHAVIEFYEKVASEEEGAIREQYNSLTNEQLKERLAQSLEIDVSDVVRVDMTLIEEEDSE